MQDLKVVLRIDGETGKVRLEFDKLEKSLEEVGESGKKAGGKVSKGMDKAGESTNAATDLVKKARNELIKFASVGLGVKLAKDSIRIADNMKLLDARIDLVTKSQEQFNIAQSNTRRIALESHTSLTTTVDLYTRLERALAGQDVAQKDVLSTTETITRALAVSGATAQETSSVITQLSQGLAAGALRGEEFNAVNESGSRIMQVLKDELNKTSGELREMAFAGELTTELITQALLNQSNKVGSEFKKLPLTVDKALTDLKTQFSIYANDVDKAGDITGKLAGSIKYLSENLETIIDTLGHALIALAAYKGVKGLQGLTLAYGRASAATGVYAAATGAATVKVGLMAAATRGLTNILKANAIGLAVTGAYLAYEGVNILIDSHNEKLKELSELSGTAKEAVNALNDEFEKGFDTQNIEVFTKSISTLESELDKVIEKQILLREEREKNAILGAEFGNGRITTGANRPTSQENGLAYQESRIKLTLKLAQANQFLTSTFGVLYQEAKIANDEQNAALESNKKAIDEWITSSEKQLEKLTRQNEVFGLTTAQIIELDAKKIKDIGLTNEQSIAVDGLVASLVKEANQLERNKAAEKARNEQLKKEQELLKLTISLSMKKYDVLQGIIESTNTPQEELDAKYEAETNAINEQLELQILSVEQYDLLNETKERLTKTYAESTEAILKENKALEELEKIKFDEMLDSFATGLNPAISALQSFKNELILISELDLSQGQKAFYSTGVAAEFALNSMAGMAQEGSDAQKKLQAAAAVTNTILGISAILEQGKGDPYTAFARMAAMAAMVASMGVQIAGAFGGGSGGGAEQQQATQGTGTVLGDADAKSESMANALDIIASASEKIVGINSSMLRSLKTMSDAISGTVNQIAQGGEIGDLGTQASSVFGTGLGSGITSFFENILFGSSKVTDRGVQILAGSISDAIDGTLFQAYEVARRSGLFGSSTSTGVGALDDDITNQISLIFISMQDAILAGAEALGLNSADVQAALDAYQIEEQRISLLDLSPEEQQAELEAVFSSIFDGLVSVSIPFLAQFQQAGEGLGETLARVSTTVLVFEEAIESMGLDFIAKEINPELFAQAAVAISDFAGGMDSFIDGYTNYVNNFLSEDQQLDILTGRIGGIFSDLDIEMPDTREGFTQLIQGLDLTTLAGQEAFGTLIALSGQMDAYYDALEQNQQDAIDALEEQIALEAERIRLLQEYNDFGASLQDQINQASSSDFINSLANIRRAESENIQTLNELAVAAGLAGASEEDLMRAHRLASIQITQTIASLRIEIASLQDQLYSEDLENRIAELEELEGIQTSGIDSVGQAANNLFDSWVRAIQSIRSYTQSLLIGDFSPLEADDRLAEAQAQFYAAIDAANAGDLDAANSVTGLANTVLELAQLTQASGSDYTAIFDAVFNALNSVDLPDGLSPSLGTYTVTPSEELQSLYNEREAREVAGRAENRLALATQLAQHLNELALAVNQPLFEIANEIGLNMTALVNDLGVNLEDLTVASVQNLANISNLLGVELSDLAFNLGEDVSLALGELADAQSLLNDALEGTIGDLPEEYRDLLAPLLQDVENAADGTAQEAALAALESATAGLPIEYRNVLAPYFESIDPISELEEQTGYLSSTVDWLEDIRNILLTGTSITGNPVGDPIGPTPPDNITPPSGIGEFIGPDSPIASELVAQTPYIIDQRDLLIDIRETLNNRLPIGDLGGGNFNASTVNNKASNSDEFKQEIKNDMKSMDSRLEQITVQLRRLNTTNDEISENTESISGTNSRILNKEASNNSRRTLKSGSVF